ncbi:Tetratricopeptide-like helical domain [Phytophthora cactorum]|nr:Tetratricopeptide-like helical domain [Phytophthora cactorum]
MWRACRVAALRQLRIEAARAPVARVPLALQQLGGVNSYFTSIAGVDRELADATAREDVTSDEIIDLFTAAQKTRAISVMVDAFNFLDANYPTHINFAVYGEIFRILTRKNNAKRLIEIYESAKPRFQAVPEIIYRFGIVGYLQNNDMDTAVEIWQEMTDAGHETTNEITSRLMMAYARKGDAEKVQELYNSVDPQIGYWHESCIDRIILSMGIIEQPAKAFEFYSNSSMKLSGGTLIALLSVCNNNNCKQQAADILANRKKFDLLLDARGYNRIMMTLEFLERNVEIKDILEEMVEKKVRFDTRTNNIIERNAEFLKDTSFVADPSKSKAAGFTLSPRIREMLAQGNAKNAATLVDSVAKPVEKSQLPDDFEGEIPEGALIVSPSVARDAVRVYIKTDQHDKVAALLKGFSVVRGKYAFALAEVVTHYLKLRNKTGDELSYAASKAMLFQGVQIYRVDDILKLFRRFHDPDAAVELFEQVLASAVVGFLCPAYVGANKQQRLELLEAFAEAQSDPNDSYVLPHLCYETLLKFTAEEGHISEVKELYEEAVASLTEKEKLGVPRGWVTILISKLAKDGNIEEGEQITKQMPQECGGYTFRAVVAVLRGAIEAQKPDIVDNMMALLEDRDFTVGLSDAYELVHLAREKDLSLKVLDIIRIFEKGNLKEVAPAEDGKGNLEAAFFRRQRGDAHALRKVKTMYSVALKLCEKEGLWKQALILRDQMTTLFGQEAMDEITASPRKHRERKEKQPDYEDHAEESAEVAHEIVEDFYEAARICRLPKLQRDVFSYMETHYLHRISFTMYVQMFDNLMAAKEFQRMRAIFKCAMDRYDPEQGQIPPEIIYRMGISAAIALEDFGGVKTLMRDMEAKGAKPSIEIVTE